MTSVCNAGASAIPNAGIEAFVIITTLAIQNTVTKLGFKEAAPFIAGVLGGISQYDTTVFCANDPPADPGLTAGDLPALLNFLDPAAQQAAQEKFKQWWDSIYWWKICSCPTGFASAEPTPSNPGSPGSNSGIPPAPVGPNCWDNTVTRKANISGIAWDFNDAMPDISPKITTSPIDASHIPTPLPTSITVTVTNHGDGAVNGNVDGFLSFWNVNGANIAGSGLTLINIAPGATATGNATVPATAVYTNTGVNRSGGFAGTPDFNVSYEVTVYCQGQGPDAVVAACCPPDPTVDSRLTAIMNLLQTIYSLIPARVPNYVAATSHTSLSGRGAIGLASTTIAVRVVFSTLGYVTTEVLAQPPTYLDLGWITPETNQGPEGGYRLTRTTEVVALPEATSIINYSLPSGATATITELQAG